MATRSGERNIFRRIWGAVRNRAPWAPPARRTRWIRDVYTRQIHEQRDRIFWSIAHYWHVNRPAPTYYFEFGCYGGNTMRSAFDHFHRLFDLTYVAFDSFEGLPEITEIDQQAIWKKGNLSISEAEFRRVCVKHGMPSASLITIPGFYDRSLNDTTQRRFQPGNAAAIYIDCDLYESTIPVLRFVKPFLQVGTIIVFDDWNCFNADPERGERRAWAEFCQANQELRFEEFLTTGMQKAFVFVG
jgi:O-methyltransferase